MGALYRKLLVIEDDDLFSTPLAENSPLIAGTDGFSNIFPLTT